MSLPHPDYSPTVPSAPKMAYVWSMAAEKVYVCQGALYDLKLTSPAAIRFITDSWRRRIGWGPKDSSSEKSAAVCAMPVLVVGRTRRDAKVGTETEIAYSMYYNHSLHNRSTSPWLWPKIQPPKRCGEAWIDRHPIPNPLRHLSETHLNQRFGTCWGAIILYFKPLFLKQTLSVTWTAMSTSTTNVQVNGTNGLNGSSSNAHKYRGAVVEVADVWNVPVG